MPVTRAEMANKILRRLGKLGIGQTATDDVRVLALQSYDEVYEQLDELELVSWGQSDSIPNKYVNDIVNWAAYNMADDIGISNERYARIQSGFASAEPNIRKMAAGEFIYESVKIANH